MKDHLGAGEAREWSQTRNAEAEDSRRSVRFPRRTTNHDRCRSEPRGTTTTTNLTVATTPVANYCASRRFGESSVPRLLPSTG